MSSFGEELRRERELRQIALREVSEATKISLRYLEALEVNEFGDLPGGVFNRGFVRAYAQYIGVDPEAMVNAYLLEEQGQSAADGGAAEDSGVMRGPRTGPEQAETKLMPERPAAAASTRLRWGLVAAVAVTLIVAVLLIYLALRNGSPGNGPAAPVETSPAASSTSEPGSTPEPPADDLETDSAAPVEPADDDADPPAAVEAAPRPASNRVTVSIRLARETSGRLNCDNRQIEVLDGMRANTTLTLACRRFLIVDAADAGAVLFGIGERAPEPLGADGERILAHRIDLSRDAVGGRR